MSSSRPHRRQRLAFLFAIAGLAAEPASAQVSAPVLKWQRGGCFTSWCQTGWYASPAVADLDGDAQADVIWGSYDAVALNGSDGSLKWRASNAQRVWPGVVVADLTGDGTLEVVVGRGGNQVTVYDRLGNVVWTRNPFTDGEVRTLAVEDLEDDGVLEVVVGRGSPGETKQVSVYEADGTLRTGWPARRDGEPGYGWGMYNENVAVADMNGDGLKEIFAPTDTHYITALDRNGNQLPVNAVYAPRLFWSEVGVHVDQAADLRGYAECGTEHRPNFANSAPVVADVDGDGTRELVVVGDVYDCSIGDPDGDLYHLPWILKLDRTRWSGSGYDWTVIPAATPGSGPLSQDYEEIENSVTNAVVADLDGDGQKEILFPSYDGRLHAFWLDKTEHGNWPYDVPAGGAGDEFRFAGEPVVADLDDDGCAEVLFTSWPRKGGSRIGHLHVLDCNGNQLHRVSLPAPFGGDDWNGGLGAPTLANIDADADLEVVVGTTASGVVAYDLPGTANARVLWRTGRGGYKRTGLLELPPILEPVPGGAITVGGTTVLTGENFTPGTRIKLFVNTGSAIVDVSGPDGFTPSASTSASLTWDVPSTVPMGQGFGSLFVVNTDQGFTTSNTQYTLLYGDPADNIPTITAIGGTPLSATLDPGVPVAHADAVVTAGAPVTVTGTGFNNPGVNLFGAVSAGPDPVPVPATCPVVNYGPVFPGGGSTSFTFTVPAGVPAGPLNFQAVNSPYVGNVLSNSVSTVSGAPVTITTVSVSGSTVTVLGTGFSCLSVINLFNMQGAGVVNLGGLDGSGQRNVPLQFVSSTELRFTRPAGAQAGAAFVEVLNPPFIPFSSSGNDPQGAFTFP
jgi:hypothetical protein